MQYRTIDLQSETVSRPAGNNQWLAAGVTMLVAGGLATIALAGSSATTLLPVATSAVTTRPATMSAMPVRYTQQGYPSQVTMRAAAPAAGEYGADASAQQFVAQGPSAAQQAGGWATVFAGVVAFVWAAKKIFGKKPAQPSFNEMSDDLFSTPQAAFAMTSEKVVGIDLGTTNSAIACMDGAEPAIITNAEGGRTTPSVVAYTKTGDLLVGSIAKRQAVVNPDNTFASVKRFIGRKMNEVTTEDKEIPYTVEASADGNVKISCPAMDKKYAPEEVSAQVLRKLVGDASKFLGTDVTKAVITVPAYFNDSQRQATKDAGRIAGLEVLRIINEPTAASLAYGLDKKSEATILVFDLGGGTFDVSVLEVGDGVFEVLSTSGDTHLGGDDFDKAIVEWLANEFKAAEGINLLTDKQALQRLTEAAEKAKQELSQTSSTEISLPFITSDNTGPKHIMQNLTRAKFDQLTSELTERCRGPINNALKDAGLTMKDLDEVVLVGGSTRIPAVKELVLSLTGKKPDQSVNVDEVVALGAAVQGGVLSGTVKDIVLLDVTPLSLGLETLGGIMTKIIPRNTTLPAAASEVFSTAADGQTTVDIRVMQGERQFVKDNKMLGTFRLDGIPPAPRGVPQIEVKFDIDTNGILSVEAVDKGTGKKQDIKITGASTLSDEDVDAMVADAEKYAAEDEAKKEAVETKNQGESMVYQTEKQLKEFEEKLDQATKDKVNAALEPLKAAVESDNTEEIKKCMEALQAEVMSMGQAMYGDGAAPGGAPGGAAGGAGPTGGKPADDDVIDADYTSSPPPKDK